MPFDPATAERRAAYRWLIGCVVPRPIAWITTRSPAGVVNLAPFSFFNGVTASPMVLSVAIAHREPLKDTLRNLRATREAVVHLAPPALLAQVHQSGADYAPEVGEAVELALATLPSVTVAPPRLAAAQVAFECRLLQEIAVGTPATALCLLEVVHLHAAPDIIAADGFPDPHRLAAPARLGGRSYLDGHGWTVVDQPPQVVPDGKGLHRG
jgi:flavin reductase (DIM6/NTAB) family NADH-FMN oxidoreductase RutF